VSSTEPAGAVKILHQRYYRGNPRRIADLEKARVSAEVARKIRFSDR
jgi:hypothetical protein